VTFSLVAANDESGPQELSQPAPAVPSAAHQEYSTYFEHDAPYTSVHPSWVSTHTLAFSRVLELAVVVAVVRVEDDDETAATVVVVSAVVVNSST
jgi:hypothetical protein